MSYFTFVLQEVGSLFGNLIHQSRGSELLSFFCRDQRKLKYFPPFVTTAVVFSVSSWICTEGSSW